MFVLNPCHSDARVRKEAATLGRAGYDVRIYGLGNSTWPEELVVEDGFTIHRLEISSVYQRAIRFLSRVIKRRAAGAPARAKADRGPGRVAGAIAALGRGLSLVATVLGRGAWRLLALLLAPFALILRSLARWAWRLFVRIAPNTANGVRADLGGLKRKVTRRLRPVRTRSRRGGRWLRAKRRRTRTRLVRLRKRLGRRAAAIRRAPRRWLKRALMWLRKTVRKRLIILHRPSVHTAFWKRATAEALAWRPDAVHGHDLNGLPPASRVAKQLGVPLVYDSHELWRRRNKVHGHSPVAKLGDAIVERRLIKRTAAVITVCDKIGEWLTDTYGLPDGHVRILRNVPVRREGDAAVTDVSLRADHGLQDAKILMYTGRITTGRGLEEAVTALAHCDPTISLVMLGYGNEEYVESIHRMAAEHLVADRLIHVPPVPSHQVAAVAAQADAAIVAVKPICLSYRYALPNKLFEAIQGHLPVVATDLPEIGRIVRDYECGELYEPGDAAGLGAALTTVMADPGTYRVGAKRAAEDLVWELEQQVLLDVYAEVLPIAPKQPASEPAVHAQ